MKWDQNKDLELLGPTTSDANLRSDLERLLMFFRRERLVIVLCTLLLALVGTVYVLQRQPSYTARSRLLVENAKVESAWQELLPVTSIVDTSMVESQVEILKSDALALRVIEELNLLEDPELSERFALRSMPWILDLLPAPRAIEQPRTTGAVLPSFKRSLLVQRLGASSLIEVGFKTDNAEKSSQIANAVIRAYLADQATAAVAATTSASAWLRDRIKDLRLRSRVISPAVPPSEKDGPRSLVLLAAFAGLGFLLGMAVAIPRSLLDTTLLEPSQVRQKLGGTSLGALGSPSVISRMRRRLDPRFRSESVLRESVDLPYSDLAYVVRNIRARGAGPIIGVRSTVPGEGTTTLAANLAYYAAAAGNRVLLVDCNVCNAGLSRQLAPEATRGLVDVVHGTADVSEVIRHADASAMHFLPLGWGELTEQADLERHLRRWSENYELVVLDLPPAVFFPVGFARNALNTLILVIQWGRVAASLVESGLAGGLSQTTSFCFVFNGVKRSTVIRSAFPLEYYRWSRGASTRRIVGHVRKFRAKM